MEVLAYIFVGIAGYVLGYIQLTVRYQRISQESYNLGFKDGAISFRDGVNNGQSN